MDPVNWLYLDLNSYFASVEQQERPELRGLPVGVVPMMADTTVLIAASYEAKAFKVKTGTKVGEAKILCPKILLVEARHSVYVRYHHAVVAAVDSCAPIDAVASIDEMVCRLSGSQREIPNAVALAHKIKETVQLRVGACMKSSIGIAPSRYLAKVASDMQKPDGLVVLKKSELPQSLYGLSLRDLPGVGAQTEKRLNERGVRTIEQLCSFDNTAVQSLWGSVWGERLLTWLRGENLELADTKHHSLSHSHVLSPEERNYSDAHKVAKKLIAKLGVRLRREGSWTTGLQLTLKFLGGGHWQNRIRLEETQDTPTFLKAFEPMWAAHPEQAPLYVSVVFSPLVTAPRHTLSLFGNPKQEKLSHVMDKINERHGRHTTHYGSLQDTDEKAPTIIAFRRIPELSELE